MKKYFIITVAIAIFASCTTEEPQMERTVFIPDPIDSRLPAYTEWGYNAFGAKISRRYFVAHNDIAPCRILYRDGLLRFSMSGYWEYNNYGSITETTLTFIFPFERLYEYADLMMLHNEKIELTASTGCVVNLSQNGKDETLNIVDGELHFCRAQMLFIDEQPNRVILSGVFNFRYLSETDEFPVTVSNGRFDFGINRDIFYAY